MKTVPTATVLATPSGIVSMKAAEFIIVIETLIVTLPITVTLAGGSDLCSVYSVVQCVPPAGAVTCVVCTV